MYGKEHPKYATSVSNLGVVYDNHRKHDEAIRLFKEAKEITGKALGIEHPSYATRLNNLAVTYLKTEKYSEALSFFEEALQILEVKMPPEHHYIVSVRESIEYCRMMMGKDVNS